MALLCVGPASLAIASAIGFITHFDGQAAILALPGVLLFWIVSPISVLTSLIHFHRAAERERAIVISLMTVNALLIFGLGYYIAR
ncbi:MAG: hypothetical protein ACAH95_06240 [Fimbriimonas sp.]